MDFKVEGTCNTKKYCRPPWFAAKKSFSILDALQWLKQPSNSFYTLKLPFFLCFSFIFLQRKKVGGYALTRTPPPPRPAPRIPNLTMQFAGLRRKTAPHTAARQH